MEINILFRFNLIILFLGLMDSHCPEWSEARASWLQLWLTLTVAVIIPLGVFLVKEMLNWNPQFTWHTDVDPLKSVGEIRINNTHKSYKINNVKLYNPIYVVCPKGDKYIKDLKQGNLKNNKIYYHYIEYKSGSLNDTNDEKDIKAHNDFYNKSNYSHLIVYPNKLYSSTITFSENEIAEVFIDGYNTFKGSKNKQGLDYWKCQHLIFIHFTNDKEKSFQKDSKGFREHYHSLLIEEHNENYYTQV